MYIYYSSYFFSFVSVINENETNKGPRDLKGKTEAIGICAVLEFLVTN